MTQANKQTPAPAEAPAKQRSARPPAPAIPPELQAAGIMKLGSPELVKMLKDPASTRFQKSKACMRLAMVGTKDAVPALASLLNDPLLSDYARFGLVPIPDPSVDDALRAALGTLKGTLLVGTIDSIGQRKDTKAVDALAKIMYGADAGAAQAAIASLGRISGLAASAALQSALAKTKDPLRSEVAAACLVCAEGFLFKGDRKQALGLYDRLSRTDIPKPVRLAAMHSTIATETALGRPK